MPYRDREDAARPEAVAVEPPDRLGTWVGHVLEEIGDVLRGQSPTNGQRRRAQRRAMEWIARVLPKS